MRWLSYTWRVLVNLFYIAVVIAVLGSIRDSSHRQIIAVLGLVYTTVRSIAIGQAIGISSALNHLDKKIDHIQYQVDSTFEKPDYDDTNYFMNLTFSKLYIDAAGLSIVSLICLFVIFTTG